jgi:putative flavoprotein involved in K+ transport
MRKIDTVVIGAGQAGLATSRCLADAGREHVVLDRGQPAESWRSTRWDSLRLLTPNWMSRLPGWSYQGDDPEGFMSAPDVAQYLTAYGESFNAPVHSWTAVTEVSPTGAGYRVATIAGSWAARHVVVAAGPRPRVPALAAELAAGVRQLHTDRYRGPAQLPPGRVLVVGASASGVQIAAELRAAGREVVLSAGRHTRLPRRYRGMDIMWWLEQTGALDRTIDQMSDVHEARREPSTQLSGRGDLDLGILHDSGVVISGRLITADGHRVRFAPDLPLTTALAESRLRRTLATIDGYAEMAGLNPEVLPPGALTPVRLPAGPDELDLRAAGISTVVWATGYDYRYPWLRVPVQDACGDIQQYQGITSAPGLYTIGLRFMHRRNSQFIDGVRHDARTIVRHLTGTGPAFATAPSGGGGEVTS